MSFFLVCINLDFWLVTIGLMSHSCRHDSSSYITIHIRFRIRRFSNSPIKDPGWNLENSISKAAENEANSFRWWNFVYWKCNFPMNPRVGWSIMSVGWLISRSVIISRKGGRTLFHAPFGALVYFIPVQIIQCLLLSFTPYLKSPNYGICTFLPDGNKRV